MDDSRRARAFVHRTPQRPSSFRASADAYFATRSRLAASAEPSSADLARAIRFASDHRGVLAVPVHAAECVLDRYLESMQDCLQRSPFNVCIFVNATTADGTKRWFAAACDPHRECVRRWNRRLGSTRIALIAARLSAPVSMGRTRALLTDALVDHHRRHSTHDPVIVCNDVDQIAAPASYLHDLLRHFEHVPHASLVAGPVAYGYVGDEPIADLRAAAVPELYLFNRINQAIIRAAYEGDIGGERRLWPEGANMAFSGSAYCAVGGFDTDVRTGEDDDLGERFHACTQRRRGTAAGWARPAFLPSAWVATDPRRVLLAIANGLTGIEAWASVDFGATHGASLDTARLARACAKRPGSLLARHVSAAAAPRGQASALAADRVAWVVLRSLVFDCRMRRFDDVARVARRVGLDLGRGRLDRKTRVFHARIRWSRSRILSEMAATFDGRGGAR